MFGELSRDDLWALALSTLAGLSTTLGGILAVLQRPDNCRLALLLGIAIGVMASLSVLEMFLHNAIEHGFWGVSASVLAGAAAFYFANPYFPEFDMSDSFNSRDKAGVPRSPRKGTKTEDDDEERGSLEAGPEHECPRNAASGSTSATQRGLKRSQSSEPGRLRQEVSADGSPSSRGVIPPAELMRLGMLMAVTMTIHNCPEGFAVAFAANTELGPMMAMAIAIHNIPEGIIVAAPVYAATGNRWMALGIATVSGLSEPLGALLALVFIRPFLSQNFLNYMIGFVGGIMLAVCVCELWPEALKCEANKQLAEGCILGTVIMLWTLHMGV
mmetsp:Transcript_20108/g.51497  ORF Transcript_20108/g.51497 Transcript_20108/m.51497 type:complete len:329 (-) Transcript_20108:63-1049(-)